MKADHLKASHLVNPLGIDIKAPLLSWTAEDGICQTAYQIVAFHDDERIWDSGRIESPRMQMSYGGPAQSRMRVHWQVRLWDENGLEGPWSRKAFFEYALLEAADFKAEWVNPETSVLDPKEHQPASVLKKEFDLTETGGARIYATAHGIYALYLNGRRVTGNLLTPGTSEYWYRLPYQTFDVEEYLHPGKNTIEVTLGDGWWRGSNGNTGTRNVFGTDIAFWLQMEVGGEPVMITDRCCTSSSAGWL